MTLKRFQRGKDILLVCLTDEGKVFRQVFVPDESKAWEEARTFIAAYPEVQEVKMYQEFNSLARELRDK